MSRDEAARAAAPPLVLPANRSCIVENLPFSGGREIGKAANNEFILLDVADFLAAK